MALLRKHQENLESTLQSFDENLSNIRNLLSETRNSVASNGSGDSNADQIESFSKYLEQFDLLRKQLTADNNNCLEKISQAITNGEKEKTTSPVHQNDSGNDFESIETVHCDNDITVNGIDEDTDVLATPSKTFTVTKLLSPDGSEDGKSKRSSVSFNLDEDEQVVDIVDEEAANGDGEIIHETAFTTADPSSSNGNGKHNVAFMLPKGGEYYVCVTREYNIICGSRHAWNKFY